MNRNAKASHTSLWVEFAIALGLVVFTFSLYLPVLSHGKIDHDDPDYVGQTMVARGLTLEGIRWAARVGETRTTH